MRKDFQEKTPSVFVSFIPLAVLVGLLAITIHLFGSDAIMGGSQLSLLSASAVAAALATIIYKVSWKKLEESIMTNMKSATSALIILLLIGSIAGSWMASGIIPTLIYYGLNILHPSYFLVASCVICAGVSLLTGSSWTTIATIGIALMGIGRALGFDDGWIAGAIISGAYFGDKISLMSDTTVLASSTSEVPLFTHIKYMMFTTIPSLVIALVVFAIAGLSGASDATTDTAYIQEALASTYNISPWLLLVPLITGILIWKKLPAIVTLFTSVVLASVALVIAQPDVIMYITEATSIDAMSSIKAIVLSATSDVAVDTGNERINELVATSGMGGMMDTIWLIICAMCFGGVMYGSGMLSAITKVFIRIARRTVSVVASTVSSGVFFNLCTGDQYISIILTSKLFNKLYDERGLERRLLSRSVEDSATVTSVLIPWNSCGMTQSTVLGVATITYLPYCIFNIVSPIMSIIVAAIGYKIFKRKENEA
ncbi:MAG: Na+/H+ antiporter NhaC family protein [Alistipes sp.]|nr:Na+/H+ antiporter NhaC family protein [Alistipes sp.]